MPDSEYREEVHRIDFAGRYVVVVTYPPDSDPDIAAMALRDTADSLRCWWESGEKFTILGVGSDVKLRFERVEVPGE